MFPYAVCSHAHVGLSCFQVTCSQDISTFDASVPRLCSQNAVGMSPCSVCSGFTYPREHIFYRRVSLSVSKQKWLICPLIAHIVEKQSHSPLVGQEAKSDIAFKKQTGQQQRLSEGNCWGFLPSAYPDTADFCISQRRYSATRCELGAPGKMAVSRVTVHGVAIHFLFLWMGHQRLDNARIAEDHFTAVLEAG